MDPPAVSQGQFVQRIGEPRGDNEQIIAMAPQLENGPSWDYDPLPVLSSLDAPMLWIQAEDDMGAPPEATRQRLIDLSAKGRPITLLEYPDTDHGIVRFETAHDGSRTSLGYAPGYFEAPTRWRTGVDCRGGTLAR